MTVTDLIKALGQFPQDMRVIVDGYEAGYDDCGVPREIEMIPDHPDGGGCYGVHMPVERWMTGDSDKRERAVILSGLSHDGR